MKKLILTLSLVAFIMVMTGCSNSRRPNKAPSTNGERFTIDTVTIHGNQHEILRDGSTTHYGGMMHSPECWCLKNGTTTICE